MSVLDRTLYFPNVILKINRKYGFRFHSKIPFLFKSPLSAFSSLAFWEGWSHCTNHYLPSGLCACLTPTLLYLSGEEDRKGGGGWGKREGDGVKILHPEAQLFLYDMYSSKYCILEWGCTGDRGSLHVRGGVGEGGGGC